MINAYNSILNALFGRPGLNLADDHLNGGRVSTPLTHEHNTENHFNSSTILHVDNIVSTVASFLDPFSAIALRHTSLGISQSPIRKHVIATENNINDQFILRKTQIRGLDDKLYIHSQEAVDFCKSMLMNLTEYDVTTIQLFLKNKDVSDRQNWLSLAYLAEKSLFMNTQSVSPQAEFTSSLGSFTENCPAIPFKLYMAYQLLIEDQLEAIHKLSIAIRNKRPELTLPHRPLLYWKLILSDKPTITEARITVDDIELLNDPKLQLIQTDLYFEISETIIPNLDQYFDL